MTGEAATILIDQAEAEAQASKREADSARRKAREQTARADEIEFKLNDLLFAIDQFKERMEDGIEGLVQERQPAIRVVEVYRNEFAQLQHRADEIRRAIRLGK